MRQCKMCDFKTSRLQDFKTSRLQDFKDIKNIVEVYNEAIYGTCQADYDETVLESWSDEIIANIEKIIKRVKASEQEIFICKENKTVLGFSSVFLCNNLIEHVYVRPAYNRKGIGAKLLSALENRALELGLSYLRVHSSITGKSFYQKNGYSVLTEKMLSLPDGVKMKCVLLKKKLLA
ncbi:MAG: GNAT family N-acetyltransferase [Oligoflexia bacterium]|nr:GNAT family N-acetyltransferase [Oligoflexia bacterium]